MSTVEYILIFTFIGSIVSLSGGILLLSRESFAVKISQHLASFAAGALLGAAFFDLLPEALHESEGKDIDIFLWTLLGVVLFFLLGTLFHWFHHHNHKHEENHAVHKERKATTPLIIISDTLHNFLDGVVIAATFLVSVPLGIITTLAVAAHEIPQEIGDFGLLLHRGVSRKRVLIINVISALFAFLGAFIAIFIGEAIEGVLPILLSLTAGFFIYIALSDIVPGIHHEQKLSNTIIGSGMLLLGILTVYMSISLLGEAH